MSTVNKAIIIGRLGSDPELRFTQSNTAVANMSIATSERYKDSNGQQQETTEWHKVVAWGRLAEICGEYLTKGSLVYIEGPIQTRSWENKEGQKQYTTEIKALTMQMLDTKKEASYDERPKQAPKKEAPPAEDDEYDDDLPF